LHRIAPAAASRDRTNLPENPLNERHQRKILGDRVTQNNRGRLHASRGPEIREPAVLTVARAAGHALLMDIAAWCD